MRNPKNKRPWVGPWLRGVREAGATDDKPAPDIASVAKRLRKSKSAISRIETGKSAIPAEDLPAFLRAYGASVDEFMRAAA